MPEERRLTGLDAAGEGREVGKRDVLVDRGIEHQPAALAVLGDEEDAVVDGIARRGDR